MSQHQAFTKAFGLMAQGKRAKLGKKNGKWYCEELTEVAQTYPFKY